MNTFHRTLVKYVDNTTDDIKRPVNHAIDGEHYVGGDLEFMASSIRHKAEFLENLVVALIEKGVLDREDLKKILGVSK